MPICFSANFLISLTALGALYLNPIPCSLLCMLMVYSRVTTYIIGNYKKFRISILDKYLAHGGTLLLLTTRRHLGLKVLAFDNT